MLISQREDNRAERRVVYGHSNALLTELITPHKICHQSYQYVSGGTHRYDVAVVHRQFSRLPRAISHSESLVSDLKGQIPPFIASRLTMAKIGSGFFVMEFHIPYLALRDKGSAKDQRSGPAGRLRHSSDIPVRHVGEAADATYHEAQISFLLLGSDEWFWTAYCFVDTYFGSEYSCEEYLNATSGPPATALSLDPPTGGEKLLDDPIWNPRGYFLAVLARRMDQVSKEWSNLVATVNNRLTDYVRLSPRASRVCH